MNDGNLPENTLDDLIDPNSRWSSAGLGQWIQYEFETVQTLYAVDIAFYKGDVRTNYFDIDVSLDGTQWQNIYMGQSSQRTLDFQTFDTPNTDIRFVRIIGQGNSEGGQNWNSFTEVNLNTDDDPEPPIDPPPSELDPNAPPSSNFDLGAWYLSEPTDNNNDSKADSIKEDALNNGYESNESFTALDGNTYRYFETGADGGMVFTCPVAGAKTSLNTSYTRVELREMLRRGDTSIGTSGVNKNNWVFSSAPAADREAAGGVDGTLKATLAVNHVTTTGSSSQVGRVIIGQIHANDDEPARLYYRKLPNNNLGSIYLAHEPIGASDTYVEIIGSRSSSADNPTDGVALGEKFSYEIITQGNTLIVNILRPGKPTLIEEVDMSQSGYDQGGQYMYFKAGVYNQNNTGSDNDFVQATFYELEQSH